MLKSTNRVLCSLGNEWNICIIEQSTDKTNRICVTICAFSEERDQHWGGSGQRSCGISQSGVAWQAGGWGGGNVWRCRSGAGDVGDITQGSEGGWVLPCPSRGKDLAYLLRERGRISEGNGCVGQPGKLDSGDHDPVPWDGSDIVERSV